MRTEASALPPVEPPLEAPLLMLPICTPPPALTMIEDERLVLAPLALEVRLVAAMLPLEALRLMPPLLA